MAEFSDASGDRGDRFPLGDREADDGFPQVLTEDPEAPAVFYSFCEIGICRICKTIDPGIVRIKIKVINPETVEFFSVTIKVTDLSCVLSGILNPKSQIPVLCNNAPGIILRKADAEALTAGGNLRNVEVIDLLCHPFFLPFFSYII